VVAAHRTPVRGASFFNALTFASSHSPECPQTRELFPGMQVRS